MHSTTMHPIGAGLVTHVLADTRLTGDAEPVAASAARVARAHRAKLTLLHVLPQLPGDFVAVAGPLVARVRSARRRAAFERMVALHPHEPRLNWLVVDGDPGVEIVRTAVRHRVDLIVLDGARVGAPDGDAGCSAARYVIDRAPCRVEVVGAVGRAAIPLPSR